MTASAGSGKTYSLVLKYIRLLLCNRDRYTYRRILAVTFTNKATDEMKARILMELHHLATSPEDSPYRLEFIPSFFPDDESMSLKARTVLHDILHDYSAFSVSTIDKFFQQTLRAFSKEIGQFASYQVELDKDSLVSESVDRVLDSLTEDDSNLLDWLTANVLEQIERGERYSLDANLLSMALRLKSTQRQEALQISGVDENRFCKTENLMKIRKCCREIIATYVRDVRQAAQRALDFLASSGVDPADSNRHFMNAFHIYAQLEDNQTVPMLTDSFVKNASNPESWFAKARRGLLDKLAGGLDAPMEEFLGLFGTRFKIYNTALILDGQIYGLGLAGELSEAFNQILKEKNVLSIDDSNTLLRDIIDGSDAPFIYEKTGVRYDHFLLDEFQDTSMVQWQNFKPLLSESDSRGGENLIVGDVKQSIYRWRGSDWNLLDKIVPEEFPLHSLNPLDSNWRSLGNIVRFNNSFFAEAAQLLGSQYAYNGASIDGIYADVSQQIRKSSDEGLVSLTFCDKDKELDAVLQSVRQALEHGAEYSDIAVLVRSNSSGERVSNYLIENGIPVLTDDSLRVKSSLTVRRLSSLMSLVDNPADTVNGYLATSLNVALPSTWTTLEDLAESLLRSLQKSDPEQAWRGEALHIQSFFDFIQDYVASEGNNLRGFLKQFAGEDPSISSPSSGNSVRVMTVHKSKGLDFNYVILPFTENISFYKSSNYWCSPNLSGTPLEGIAEGVYDVSLSQGSESTLFNESYRRESFLQMVDNINILYVAMTRAVLGMHIIAKTPPAKCVKAVQVNDLTQFKDFSQMLWWFASSSSVLPVIKNVNDEESERYDYGNMVDFRAFRKSKDSLAAFPISSYGEIPSFPLNPDPSDMNAGDGAEVDVRERGRLKFSADSVDFFAGDDGAGISASGRVRGIVLHDILSRVVVPEDLEPSVRQAVADGDITSAEAAEVLDLLSQRISEAQEYGWFPKDGRKVLNETSLVDVDGQIYRPDRVIRDGNKITIIDYKTGAHEKKYVEQLGRYAGLWHRMGYGEVEAVLWYLAGGERITVEKIL